MKCQILFSWKNMKISSRFSAQFLKASVIYMYKIGCMVLEKKKSNAMACSKLLDVTHKNKSVFKGMGVSSFFHFFFFKNQYFYYGFSRKYQAMLITA